jgi:hypothetical protein
MVIGGGAENCLGAAEDTGTPWAAAGDGLPAAEAEGDAAAEAAVEGLGSGLKLLLTCADDGAEAGRVGAGVGAAGAAVCPQAVSNSSSALRTPGSKRTIK